MGGSRAPWTELMDGLGAQERKVTTASPPGPAFSNRGLRLTYGFTPDEAARSLIRPGRAVGPHHRQVRLGGASIGAPTTTCRWCKKRMRPTDHALNARGSPLLSRPS